MEHTYIHSTAVAGVQVKESRHNTTRVIVFRIRQTAARHTRTPGVCEPINTWHARHACSPRNNVCTYTDIHTGGKLSLHTHTHKHTLRYVHNDELDDWRNGRHGTLQPSLPRSTTKRWQRSTTRIYIVLYSPDTEQALPKNPLTSERSDQTHPHVHSIPLFPKDTALACGTEFFSSLARRTRHSVHETDIKELVS